ncbi:hypothetical protein V7161_26910 [Neobacillus drentensis]
MWLVRHQKWGKKPQLNFFRGCEQFKAFHKHLFGIEVRSFVMDDKQFKKVKNWMHYFHPNGIYR